MADEPRLRQLLDELLDAHATPEEVCRSCPELLPEVRARWLRVCHVRAELDALFPAPTLRGVRPPAPLPGVAPLPQIPGYEVEAVLGIGGMGVVFRARQLRLNRLVALKMVLAGAYAGPRERERFRREAEAVAALRHPNIVPVYEAGDVDGRPYFAMEFVEGGSLAQQVQGVPQPVRKAAALVATLAGAIHAAHQGGIIHRDLKPANILLAADGTPRVTDFGLARRLQGGDALTRSGDPMGTPSYMAPEQARGDKGALGPATDVYALGAILYELLTGRPPFRSETAVETLRQVIAQDPVPPTRLNAAVPRDLETICLKCLRKEPQRRYASAAALGDDLTRFLEGRPILARPLGRAARLWRWARRNPMAAAICAVLLAAAVISTGLAVLAARAEAAAKSANAQAQKRLEQVERANDLLGSIFENLDPEEIARAGRPLQAILVEKLDRAAGQLEGESVGAPLVVANMQERFALSLVALGEPAKAIGLHEKALATRRDALGPDDPRTLASMYHLAVACKAAGNLDRALPLQEETLGRMKAALGPDHPGTLKSMDSIAAMYDHVGKRGLALPLFEETLRLRKATLGAEHPDTLTSMANLGIMYSDEGKLDLALPLLEEALKLQKAILGHADPHTLVTTSQLALTYQAAGKLDLALPLFEETFRLRKATLGPEHPDTLMSMYHLAMMYQSVGKPKLALPLMEEGLRVKKARLGTEHPDTRNAVNQLDFLHNLVTAEDRYQTNLAKLGPDHINTLLARRDIAQLYMSTNRLDEAELTLVEVIDRMKTRANDDPILEFTIRLLRYCLTIRERATADSWHTFRSKSLLGGVYLRREQYAAAEPLLLAGYEGMKKQEAKIPPQEKARLTEAVERLVLLYEATARREDAAKWRKELEALRREARPLTKP